MFELCCRAATIVIADEVVRLARAHNVVTNHALPVLIVVGPGDYPPSQTVLSFVKTNAHASCARSFLRMSIVICSHHTGEWWGARHIDGSPLRLFLLALSSGSGGGDWGIGHLSFPSHEDHRLLAID